MAKKVYENVRHYVLKVHQSNEKGWCNGTAATINLRCNEIFTPGSPKKLKGFAHKRRVKNTSTNVDVFTFLHTQVKIVDAEDHTIEKSRTLDLPRGNKILTSKMASQNLSFESEDQDPMITLHKRMM